MIDVTEGLQASNRVNSRPFPLRDPDSIVSPTLSGASYNNISEDAPNTATFPASASQLRGLVMHLILDV
jgi:hypothetical protein